MWLSISFPEISVFKIADSPCRPQLNENDALELIGRLIDHYVFLVNGGEPALVIRKLASSLATIFLKPNAPWTLALRNIAASLANGKHLSETECRSLDLANTILPAMAESQVVALLYFSNILAEEINKWNAETRRSGENQRVVENIQDALSLVEYILSHILQREASGNSVPDATPGIEAISSYQVSQESQWIFFSPFFDCTCGDTEKADFEITSHGLVSGV